MDNKARISNLCNNLKNNSKFFTEGFHHPEEHPDDIMYRFINSMSEIVKVEEDIPKSCSEFIDVIAKVWHFNKFDKYPDMTKEDAFMMGVYWGIYQLIKKAKQK